MDEHKNMLPLARISKICKFDPEMNGISGEAAKLLTFATEIYVKLLAKEACRWAQNKSRKTIQKRDIEKAIQKDWIFTILEDALDWPEHSKDSNVEVDQNIKKDSREDITEEIMEEDVVEEGIDEEEVEDDINEEEDIAEEETDLDETEKLDDLQIEIIDRRQVVVHHLSIDTSEIDDVPSTSRGAVKDIEEIF